MIEIMQMILSARSTNTPTAVSGHVCKIKIASGVATGGMGDSSPHGPDFEVIEIR
jgi:hypothetical protein